MEKPNIAVEADPVIRDMDEETFIGFHKELQYGLKWNDVGLKYAQSCMTWAEPVYSERNGAIDGAFEHRRRKDEIKNSDLYVITREEITNKLGFKLPNNWFGWLTMDSQEESDSVNSSLETLFRDKYSIPDLSAAKGVGAEELEQAKETLNKFGFEGVFTDYKTDLLSTFMQRYDTRG